MLLYKCDTDTTHTMCGTSGQSYPATDKMYNLHSYKMSSFDYSFNCLVPIQKAQHGDNLLNHLQLDYGWMLLLNPGIEELTSTFADLLFQYQTVYRG